MASSSLLLLLLFIVSDPLGSLSTSSFSFDIHHRFSDPVRKFSSDAWPSPEKGSREYYTALVNHDRALRGRRLSETQELTFVDGNSTFNFPSLGFLYYAIVAVGTPNVTFLVALDTGSDLFWLPCECQSCAPTSSQNYGLDLVFDTYSPKNSSTSKTLPCNSSYCEHQSECSKLAGQCPYKVQYATANTSTSGILVEDVLYLTTENTSSKVVQAPIVFGCGQVQTGSFLKSAAPNGLFGLGMDKISVPSILSSAGLTSNSFSMCFRHNGVGRISFGDKGSSDQGETAFHIEKGQHPSYNISITGVNIGSSSVDVNFSAIVDSGTSFTSLADPSYTLLANDFNAQVKEKRQSTLDGKLPFEYCYQISPNATSILLPFINLTTEGGSQFPVHSSVVLVTDKNGEYFYCLAILKASTSELNIIGQNFMSGLRIVFDRERLVLGWKNSDCYDTNSTEPEPANPPISSAFAPNPSITIVPSNPQTVGNNKQGSSPSSSAGISQSLSFSRRIILMLFLLCFTIF
ncbi:aspartyl protease family protein 1-like [Dioscorea cayenensis subsp. rotundata]|uniref:Aspartyl protease family protein 1-like n=1 Tax=Dioscorea cayennensis subsp. rotundata TaxID=55577 RepID=A0AB40BAL7_DIOCR|nr:aspartyl protease family protein 1-like [Dioscorea cayenensis subsp. rotundata]